MKKRGRESRERARQTRAESILPVSNEQTPKKRKSASRDGRTHTRTRASDSHHGQMLWTLFVAIIVALVALQQSLRPSGGNATAAQVSTLDTPGTLVTGKPLRSLSSASR